MQTGESVNKASYHWDMSKWSFKEVASELIQMVIRTGLQNDCIHVYGGRGGHIYKSHLGFRRCCILLTWSGMCCIFLLTRSRMCCIFLLTRSRMCCIFLLTWSGLCCIFFLTLNGMWVALLTLFGPWWYRRRRFCLTLHINKIFSENLQLYYSRLLTMRPEIYITLIVLRITLMLQ